jgi:transcriptional regulator with XRE-family HTH domain
MEPRRGPAYGPGMSARTKPVGEHLREWRRRRRMSQLDLACEAGVSTRHLSFLETGRTAPSRDMVLRLTERLEVPLRERNVVLLAAGFVPLFPERPLDHPDLRPAREAVERLLRAHEPYPALAVNGGWTLVAANRAVAPLTAGAAPWLLRPPVNVLRLSLHPEGLAPRIVNLGEWRAHLLDRVRRQVEQTAAAALAELLDELEGYPGRTGRGAAPADAVVAVPLRLATDAGVLSFLSATLAFGTPLDVTLSELALETFLPADGATAERLRRWQEGRTDDPGGGPP